MLLQVFRHPLQMLKHVLQVSSIHANLSEDIWQPTFWYHPKGFVNQCEGLITITANSLEISGFHDLLATALLLAELELKLVFNISLGTSNDSSLSV